MKTTITLYISCIILVYGSDIVKLCVWWTKSQNCDTLYCKACFFG